MIKQAFLQGTNDALRTFGLKEAAVAVPAAPGFFARQLGAAKSLGANLRGGFGGQHNPAVLETLGVKNPATLSKGDAAALPGIHRQEAWGNAKELLPSAAIAAAGLYGAKKLFGKSDEQKRLEAQQRMMGMGG